MPAAAQARTDLPGRAATPAGATIICLIAVIVLPLLSFPLSWLPAAAGPRSFTIPWGPLLAVPVLLMAAWHLARYGTIGGRRTVTWCSLALLVSALLGVRFSDQPHASLSVLPVVVSNLVLFVAASRLPAASRWLLAWGWIAAAGLVAVNGLGRLGHEPEFLSVIGNRNLLGAYLASGICLGTGLAVHRDTSRSLRWLALGAAVLLVVALWFCGSRGAWLGLLAGLAAFGVLSLPCGRLALSLVLVLVLVLVSGLLPWTRAHLARQWRADVRPVIWAGTIRMVEDRPLLGHGLGSYLLVYPQYRLPTYFARPKAAPVTDHAHNEFLETAAEQG
ncbi:O-antigen ligase family protein, partial [bacterium]|nr:O-antigen ligase family protein [bacterium]